MFPLVINNLVYDSISSIVTLVYVQENVRLRVLLEEVMMLLSWELVNVFPSHYSLLDNFFISSKRWWCLLSSGLWLSLCFDRRCHRVSLECEESCCRRKGRKNRWHFCVYFFLAFLFFQLTPWEALKAELLFAVNIWIITKPVHNRLSESESPKSASRSQKSRSRLNSESRSSFKDKSVHSVNLNNETNGFASRSISGLNRIGNFFGKKCSD